MKQESLCKIDESQILVELLCNGKWENEWFDFMDTDEFIELAIKNKVLSTVAFRIFERGIDSLFKGTDAYSRLKEALLLNERDIFAYKKVLDLLVGSFAESQIYLCLLKGLSLKNDVPRDMGDLDLLIHEGDLQKAITLMEESGFVYVGDKRNRYMHKNEIRNWDKLSQWSNQFEFVHSDTGVLVELHTNLFERCRVYRFKLDLFLDNIDEFWKRVVWSEQLQCKVLSSDDQVWLLAMHNAIKRTPAKDYFALRTILDIRNLLVLETPDWDNLIQRAYETDTLVFLIYSLEMTSQFFPELDLAKAIGSGNKYLKKREKFLIKIMLQCFYNLKTFNYSYGIQFRLFTPLILKSRGMDKFISLLIIPILFLPPWHLRQLYLLMPKSKLVVFTYLLEPIRWIRIALRKKKTEKGTFRNCKIQN